LNCLNKFCRSYGHWPVHDQTTDLFMPGCHICRYCCSGLFFVYNDSLGLTWQFLVLYSWWVLETSLKICPSQCLTQCTCFKLFVGHRLTKTWLRLVSQVHVCWGWDLSGNQRQNFKKPILASLEVNSRAGGKADPWVVEYQDGSHPRRGGESRYSPLRFFI
jgi:hypothetical protein